MISQSEFSYTRHGLNGRDKRLQRFLEILPGAASLCLIVGLVLLSWFRPVWALVFIIAFDSLCLCYLGYTLSLLALSSCRLGLERHTDWMARVRMLDELHSPDAAPLENRVSGSPRQRLSEWLHRRKLRRLKACAESIPHSSEFHHVVIVPVITESRQEIDFSLRSLLAQSFPSERTMVILAIEAEANRRVKKGAWELHREYYEHFLALYIAPHRAAGSPREIRRAASISTAAKMAAQALQARGIPLNRAIITCLEPNAAPEPQYLACAAWHFMACPRRDHASFQPVPVYHRNIWSAPSLARVLHVGSSFFHLIEASNPEKLVTFSSHSMSLQTLADAGFWPADMVSSDASVFWKCYLRFNGDYWIEPMQIPLWLDIPHEGCLRSAVKSVYREHRRWAWGIENAPIILRGFLTLPGIPLIHKIRHGFKLLVNPLGSATGLFIVVIIGWLPALFAAIQTPPSIVAYNAALIQSLMFGFVSVVLVIAGLISLLHLPLGSMSRPLRQLGGYLCSWLLLPLFGILLNTLPTLEVQTRMMFSRYPHHR